MTPPPRRKSVMAPSLQIQVARLPLRLPLVLLRSCCNPPACSCFLAKAVQPEESRRSAALHVGHDDCMMTKFCRPGPEKNQNVKFCTRYVGVMVLPFLSRNCTLAAFLLRAHCWQHHPSLPTHDSSIAETGRNLEEGPQDKSRCTH